MILPNITQELTEHLAQEYARVNREQTIDYFETRYRELEGDVYTDKDLKRIWPKRYRESQESYNERVKIWGHAAKIVINRVVSMILQGNVRREWQGGEDADQTQLALANEFNELWMEVNDWDFMSNQVYYYALGIGELAMWPEFRRFDKMSGEPYQLSNGGIGIPKWSYWFPWFVEPISLQDYADEIIGAAKLIFLDNMKGTPLLTQAISGGTQQAITELWMSPTYSHMTGREISSGFYRKWINGVLTHPENEDGTPDTVWAEKNILGTNPVVFFKSPDPDETQYRGCCYFDRFRDLMTEHSRTISNIGQAIDVLPNIWKYTGEQKSIDKIVIRTNEIVQIPPDGIFEQATRELNLGEDWRLVNYLEKTIALLGAVPAEVWDNLGSAGKVESGVALRLTMQPMIEQAQQTQKALAVSEKQMMRKGVRMYNAYNPDKQIDTTNLRPEVVYEENLLPVDEATEVINDIMLFDKGAKKLTDLVRKYNPQITTEAQAENFIIEAQQNRPQQPQQTGLVRRARA